ncbi:transposase [Bacillus sp. V3-13]|uniref:transposase n=1 Tax=Bacillus sp. V3-13 TaxID=2053728 RepID=UPI0011573B44|nr:transposase [Bacillus sp. V3-13]
MARQWLRQLISCTSKIYDLKQLIKLYEDSRIYPRIKPEVIGLCMLFGYLFRMPSLERLEYWIRCGVFRRLAKGQQLPTVDTIRESLRGADLSQLQLMNEQIIKKARRNKVLRGGTIDGWVVSAIDGVELFESVKKSSQEALTRVIDGVTHYYYRFVGCMTIGMEPRIVWGMEPLKVREGDSCQKDEGEITAAKRLVKQLYERFHHFTDILVCDALYAKAPFINLVTSFNIDLIIRMKDMRLDIVKDALGLFSKRKPDRVWTTKEKNQVIRVEAWEAYDMEMANVLVGIRFVRFVEHTQILRRGKVIKTETKEILLVTTCQEEVKAESIWKMIHKRWDIENCLFHQLKTHCHMDHRFVDGLHAITACIYLQMVAFNLWQLYLFRYLRQYDQKKHPQVAVAERMRIECEIDSMIPPLLSG